MIIRPALIADFENIVKLLTEKGVEPPAEPSDMMGGIALVAEEDGKFLGCIYAIHGGGTLAYADFFAGYSHRAMLTLSEHLETVLRMRGVKRLTFDTERDNIEFERIVVKKGCRRLRDLTHWRREL